MCVKVIVCLMQAYTSCLAELPQADILVMWVETKLHNGGAQMLPMSQLFRSSRIFQVSDDMCLDLHGWTQKHLWVSCRFEGCNEVMAFLWSFNGSFVLLPRSLYRLARGYGS